MGWRGAIVGTVTLAVVLGGLGVGAVAAFSITGINLSGNADVIGGGTEEDPFEAKAGFVRNVAPWRLAIVDLKLDDQPAPDGVRIAVVSRDRFRDEPPATDSTVWHGDLADDPLSLRADQLSRALWISVAPREGEAIAFSRITLTYRGPLGLEFSTSTRQVKVIAFSAELGDGIASLSPQDDLAALAGYVQALRPLIAAKDPVPLAPAMGVSEEEAAAFLATQPGAIDGGSYETTAGQSPFEWSVILETGEGAARNAPFTVEWADNRWKVIDW